jgi:HSP20 family protein
MTKLTTYTPNVFGNLLDDFLTPGYIVRPLHGQALDSNFKVDISENKKGFSIKAEIPGAKKEDIHITVDGALVTIQAETKQIDQKTEDEKVVRSECYYGTVSRSFQLPAEVEEGSAKANYENGVLNLILPKKNGGNAHQIKVS